MRPTPEHLMLTHGPVVRVEPCDLVRIVDMDGYGDLRIMRFRRDVLWIRETSTWAEFLNPWHTSSPLPDFHGFMTSMDSVLPNAIDYSIKNPSSTVSVLTCVSETPCVEFTQTSAADLHPSEWECSGRKPYLRVRSDWGRNDGKVETALAKKREPSDAYDLNYITPTETNMTIWSSLHSPALNDHLMKSLESYRP